MVIHLTSDLFLSAHVHIHFRVKNLEIVWELAGWNAGKSAGWLRENAISIARPLTVLPYAQPIYSRSVRSVISTGAWSEPVSAGRICTSTRALVVRSGAESRK